MSRWYVAVLVMQCKINGVPSGSTDLQIRIVQASSDEDAFSKALFLGKSKETSYPGTDDDVVTWEFQGLHELDAINAESLSDGTEVWNQITKRPASMLIREKASLAVFWLEANKDRKVSDILREQDT